MPTRNNIIKKLLGQHTVSERKHDMSGIRRLFVSLTILGLVAGVGQSYAGTATATAAVSATVPRNCSITATPLSFGSYDPFGANATSALDTTSTISVACTKAASVSIGINQGSNSASGSTTDAPLRQLGSGSDLLRYDLYTDSARSQVWGDIGGTKTQSYTSTSKNTVTPFNVYARVPANQDVADGTYSDQITATVLF
jgi:spore coat protein U-like protein